MLLLLMYILGHEKMIEAFVISVVTVACYLLCSLQINQSNVFSGACHVKVLELKSNIFV